MRRTAPRAYPSEHLLPLPRETPQPPVPQRPDAVEHRIVELHRVVGRDDRVIDSSATGRLFFDADGTGSGVQSLFATVASSPAITAGELFVSWRRTRPGAARFVN